MQQQIESLILSNVGNRLTQELAYGLIMSVLQVAQQGVNAALAAAQEGAQPQVAETNQVDAQATAGVGCADYVEPAYRAQPAAESPAPAEKKPRRTRKPTTPKKARR